MKHLSNPVLALALASLASAHAAEVPIDLNSWQKLGPVANGNWVVAPGGQSVTQTINDDPTFFVGPDSLINTVLRGRIVVNTTGDDDFIGFVMGYQGPSGTGNDMDFVLLDWKQNSQNNGGFRAQEGFALSRVKGTITSYLPGFWGHTEDSTWDVLGTNQSSTMGWADFTEYRFAITYLADRVTVAVTGGAFATETMVLDVAGSFPEGRFGFYNFSQANVTYSGFTVENLPPPVPEPGTWALLAAGLATVAGVARRSARA
ncbi:MAG: PEP-CTERM sorting domain-containing protein [Aquabacterium sp.]